MTIYARNGVSNSANDSVIATSVSLKKYLLTTQNTAYFSDANIIQKINLISKISNVFAGNGAPVVRSCRLVWGLLLRPHFPTFWVGALLLF